MLKWTKKHLISFCLVILISCLGIFVFGVKPAQAFGFDDMLNAILQGIGHIILGVLWGCGQILLIVAKVIQGLIYYTEFTKSDIVTTGWGIVRDITNMFFVLILLVIALATILRVETYGMKALLPKLIIAALLINFSLVIAGPIIDFSQILTDFFIEQSGGKNFTEEISNALNLSKITTYEQVEWQNCKTGYSLCRIGCLTALGADACREDCNQSLCEPVTVEETEKLNWGKGTMDTVNVLVGLSMAVIFTIIAIFAFGAFAFFLVVRILILWFLLIMAPIVWLLWILPNTRQQFTKWWSTFIKWSFFAPIYMFFVYLALRAFPTLLNEELIEKTKTEAEVSGILPNIISHVPNLLQFLLVLGILLGGLMVAQQMSVYGAKGAIGIAKGTGKKTRQWAGRRARLAAARPAGAIGRGLQRALKSVPGARRMAKPFRAFAEKERASLADVEKQYGGWTSDHLKAQYKTVDARGKAAIAKILASRGDFKENASLGFGDKEIKQAVKLTKRYEQHRDILKSRPDLAPLVGEDIEKTIAGLKPADMEKIQIEAIGEKPEERTKEQRAVIKAFRKQLTDEEGKLRGAHLSKMVDVNPKVSVLIRKEVIEPDWGKFRNDVQSYLESDAGKAIFGEMKKKGETFKEGARI